MWVFRRGNQCTNRVSRGNINGILNMIWGIAASFVWSGTSSRGMVGRFKSGLLKSTGNVFLKQS